ncbi:Gfo/Idh/MocA family protein [Methylomonas methanica]|uniref:Trans-1,2-dihydrobenzene-1,2-diol dehydrogenase n=1 Tax=Methylomonas methanica (strain DSM 25384 / MC09) TaxID=857087 RepID=G0A0I6_METMM|nr:Gfo/Idh/MocA family oxidoreductase [Methylomonas methanica]AEF98762.1 Trans-1,2-dihydrobenzene-1,2-diol dehydrogenase [Methylomonas methanica MC09]
MNNQAKLRWGILGAARVNERLLPAILEAANAELIAIASRRPGAAAETLAKYAPCYPHIQAYDDLDALLANPDVQAVYLPMANHEHAEWALRAIAQRKHVLCEKPMALTVADIDAIETAARRYKVTVMEGFMYRFHPQHARVREILNSGLIGEIRSVRASFSFMMRPARMYRLANDVKQGGGAMWDIGCYAIHSLRMFFDKPPLAVTAMARYADSGADISTSGILDYGDGKFAQFDFSFERARRCEYEIVGTQGGLKCHVVWQLPGDVPVISWWTEDGRQGEERLPASNHFNLEIEHFSDCVLNNKEPRLSFEDARENCQIIVAALESAATGQVVKI